MTLIISNKLLNNKKQMIQKKIIQFIRKHSQEKAAIINRINIYSLIFRFKETNEINSMSSSSR